MHSHAQLALLTATRCCVCSATLTDAESVENGIGPCCSKRYYNPTHVPTEEEVQDALGWLATSELPDHIVTGFLALVNNDRVNARKGCNLLIYWASCNYTNRAEVFKCSAIIRALGYKELADKLETDRTEAVVTDCGTHIEVFLPDKTGLNRDVASIPGAKPLVTHETGITGNVTVKRVKRGHKIGWTVPKVEEAHLECVLGIHLHDKLACGTKGVRKIPYKRYSDLLEFRRPPKQIPLATPVDTDVLYQPTNTNLYIRILSGGQGGRVKVITPYNDGFVVEIRKLGWKNRTWNPRERLWEVDRKYLDRVVAIIEMAYKVRLVAA